MSSAKDIKVEFLKDGFGVKDSKRTFEKNNYLIRQIVSSTQTKIVNNKAKKLKNLIEDLEITLDLEK
jgi:hypothetical protein